MAKDLSLSELDQLTLEILLGLKESTMESAEECTKTILHLASLCMDDDTFAILKKFVILYNDQSGFKEVSVRVNEEVDRMIDELEGKKNSGDPELENVDLKELKKSKMERLGLAGIQKKLEGLVRLDLNIRSKIVPVLTSMQFEDASGQRLKNLYTGNKMLVEAQSSSDQDVAGMKKQLSTLPTSVEETGLFYKVVLNEEPPKAPDVKDPLFF